MPQNITINGKTDILSLTLPQLEAELERLGEKKFRAAQIYDWLHVKKITDFSSMTNFLYKFTIYCQKTCLEYR